MFWRIYDDVGTVILGVAFYVVVFCMFTLTALYAVDRVRSWWREMGGHRVHGIHSSVRNSVRSQTSLSQFQMGETSRAACSK